MFVVLLSELVLLQIVTILTIKTDGNSAKVIADIELSDVTLIESFRDSLLCVCAFIVL